MAVPDYPSAKTHKTLQQTNKAAVEVSSVLGGLKIRYAVKKDHAVLRPARTETVRK